MLTRPLGEADSSGIGEIPVALLLRSLSQRSKFLAFLANDLRHHMPDWSGTTNFGRSEIGPHKHLEDLVRGIRSVAHKTDPTPKPILVERVVSNLALVALQFFFRPLDDCSASTLLVNIKQLLLSFNGALLTQFEPTFFQPKLLPSLRKIVIPSHCNTVHCTVLYLPDCRRQSIKHTAQLQCRRGPLDYRKQG